MKIIITGANPHDGNCGLGALSFGAFEAIINKYPDAELLLLDYFKQPVEFRHNRAGRTYTISSVGMRFSWKLFLRNNIINLLFGAICIRVLPFPFVKKAFGRLFPSLGKLLECNRSFAIAGGDSFSDIYGLGQFLYVLLPQILLLILKIPLIQLPQTFGPFNKKMNSVIAGTVLKGSLRIYTRELRNVEYVEKFIGSASDGSRVQFMYDIGFLLKPVETDVSGGTGCPDAGHPHVGLNVSGLLHVGGFTRNNQFGLLDDYKSMISDIITFFTNQQKLIVLIPHVLGESVESDRVAVTEIGRNFSDNQFVSSFNKVVTAPEIKYVIGSCDFFIGARMHACIAAISQGIPTICMAYSKKFIGTIGSLGLDELVIDLRSTDRGTLLQKVEKIYTDKELIREKINGVLPTVFNQLKSMEL